MEYHQAIPCTWRPAVIEAARDFVFADVGYRFTSVEAMALKPFFTNLEKRVFFVHGIPANVGATALSMYSRIKNPRGLRGVWVDTFLPQFLAAQFLPENEVARFFRERRIRTLDGFVAAGLEARAAYEEFLKRAAGDPEYLAVFAEARKARAFLDMWLDRYGHNSIARMGSVWVCFEDISLLAAKSLEWGRPGAGYIELSTRYVDMSERPSYPIEQELAAGWRVNRGEVQAAIEHAFGCYEKLTGANFDGPFPEFLRERYRGFYADAPKDLEAGVIGETCDALGNLLPAATLTSVGVNVSGEAFPEMLKHLLLDNTPENVALAELCLAEARKVGVDQFARHFLPSEWAGAHWQYRDVEYFRVSAEDSRLNVLAVAPPERDLVEGILTGMLLSREYARGVEEFLEMLLAAGFEGQREEYDKLPAEFEAVTFTFTGVMSFRGWRDLQRMSFSTHFRTLVTPALGFYAYDKPHPPELEAAFREVGERGRRLWLELFKRDVPAALRQYVLAMGNRVGFVIGANLRQWEFSNWQRCKYSVNHEVRQVFLGVERYLRQHLPWWGQISRADTTPAYIFARGEKQVPLSEGE